MDDTEESRQLIETLLTDANDDELKRLHDKIKETTKPADTQKKDKVKSVISDFKHEISYVFKFHKYVRALIIVMVVIIVLLIIIIATVAAKKENFNIFEDL